LPAGALASLHPRLDRAILNVLGQLGEQVSVLYLPSGFGDWARRYHVLALPMQQRDHLLGVIYVFRQTDMGGFSDRDLHVLDVFARQAAGALDQARATAEMLAEKTRLEEMQSTFVSIVSHELQTPVAIIKSYAATLAREDAVWTPETIQRVSRNIEDECDRLHRLITDLLDLSRIQAGRVAMRVGSVDLPQLAVEVIDQLAPRAPRHSLRTSFPPNFPIIRGDQDQLRRALLNLVQNAIKYSPNGGDVLLTVGTQATAAGAQATLSIHDNGVGIPTAELPRVFARFYRGSNVASSIAGTGIGLAGAKQLIEQHGGTIGVVSVQGQGSTFLVQLPLLTPRA
jgi:signal transduction histidine kinase